MSGIPIRLRLTLLFVVAMATLLAAIGLFVYHGLGSALDGTIDRNLRSRLDTATSSRLSPQEDGFVEVVALDGKVVRSSRGSPQEGVLSPTERLRAASGEIVLERRLTGFEEPVRVMAIPVTLAGQRRIAIAGDSLEPRADALESLLTQLAIAGPAALLFASIAAYLLAAAALRPVEAMRVEADAVSAAEPGRRLPLPRSKDEIARLGTTLNQMLARLEDAIARERRFVADASHELRTPLAALRTELELAHRHNRSREELQAALKSASEETERLSQLAEDLLLLARSESGRLPVRRERLEVEGVLRDVSERYARRAELEIDAEPGLIVSADRLRTEQALGNLVENALRHGGAPFVLTASRRNGSVLLGVRDAGGGFNPTVLETAFEPFTLGDPGRTGQGAGLGLAIVDVIARAHGGSAHVANRDGGAEAWIELPS